MRARQGHSRTRDPKRFGWPGSPVKLSAQPKRGQNTPAQRGDQAPTNHTSYFSMAQNQFKSPPEVAALRSWVQDTCRASKAWDHSTISTAWKVSCSLRNLLEHQAKTFIHKSRLQPLLYWYASDGWVAKVRHFETFVGSADLEHDTFRRQSMDKQEFILQRANVKGISIGGVASQSNWIIGANQPLNAGDGASNTLNCINHFFHP